MLEKTLESLLDCMEIQPVHPKGNQSWLFIERIDVEAETPILWPPDVKSWLIWKDRLKARRRGWQRMRWWMASLTQWTWVWTSSRSWWGTWKPCGMSMLQAIEWQSQTQLSDWTELNKLYQNSENSKLISPNYFTHFTNTILLRVFRSVTHVWWKCSTAFYCTSFPDSASRDSALIGWNKP